MTGGSHREDIGWRRFQTEAMLAFSRVHQQILRRTAKRLADGGVAGITPARANALIVLFNARGPIQAQELARELGVTEVTVSRVIKRMEQDGWVERTPDPLDGRAMLLTTTARARDMFPTLVRVSNQVLDDLFCELDREELRAMSGFVSRIQEGLASAVGDADEAPEG